MSIGLIGKKCGMTRVFTAAGESIPVTVLEVQPNRVVQHKIPVRDGYHAIQMTFGHKSASHMTNALIGHYAKSQTEAGVGLWEFRLYPNETEELTVGAEIDASIFKEGDFVDVQGTTKGKGYTGVIKRHHFSSQDASHGNSLSHRAPGSIGQRQTPGRVFKGKKMAGHLGDEVRTIKNLLVVKVDSGRNLLLVKGGVPGASGGYVVIKFAVLQVAKGRKEKGRG